MRPAWLEEDDPLDWDLNDGEAILCDRMMAVWAGGRLTSRRRQDKPLLPFKDPFAQGLCHCERRLLSMLSSLFC
jgi:hypothetical protein